MGIFRPAATRKLASPEQLDTLACVISPLGWLAIFAVAVLFLAVGLWGFYGRIPTKAAGAGMITQSAGVCEVTPTASGLLAKLGVVVGDTVRQGGIVAEVSLPSLLEQIRQLQLELQQFQAKRMETERFNQESSRQRAESRALRKKGLEQSRADNKERIKWAEQNLKAQEGLFREGVVAATVVVDARMTLQSVQHADDTLDQQLQQLTVESAEEDRQHQAELLDIDRQITSKQLQLEAQQREQKRQSQVTCPCSGRVIEIIALVGDAVSGQQPILLVEQESKKVNDLTAILFLSSEDGKKVRPGMRALINPSTVKATEYGGIKGLVTGVSDHPVSSRSVSRLLANPDLGQSLAASGSQFQVTVNMVEDTASFSGFQWTSGKGPQVVIGSGTPCGGEIILEEVPPVSFVIPFFKKVLLGQTDELRGQPR